MHLCCLDKVTTVSVKKNGITLNTEKFVAAVPAAFLHGYWFARDETATDAEKVCAIRDFATAANLIHLRFYLNLVDQLAEFFTTSLLLPCLSIP